MKHGGEAIHLLLQQGLDRFRRHVLAGEAGAAGGDDDVDALVPNPGFYLFADRFHLILYDGPRDDPVARAFDPLLQQRAGSIGFERALIGDRQHRDRERHEGNCRLAAKHRQSSQKHFIARDPEK